jgi:hypothetical protein
MGKILNYLTHKKITAHCISKRQSVSSNDKQNVRQEIHAIQQQMNQKKPNKKQPHFILILLYA